jgi:hypothetical protein
VQKRFEKGRDNAVRAAVAAEIAWLDGAKEPAWPAFPNEEPILRVSSRIPVSGRSEDNLDDDVLDEFAEGDAMIHADSTSAARWLRLLTEANGKSFDWGGEIVHAYDGWSARVNGAKLPAEAEVDRSPSEWNAEFYALFAEALMNAAPDQFDVLVEQVTALPDQSFGDVVQTLLHAADALYFNDASRSSERPVELRARIATRTMALRRWRYNYSPGNLSVDHDTAGVVAKILLNTHDPFRGARSYLVPAVADRLDPLLEPMRPLQAGGPTSFVAFCTMNMLLVAPRARHLDFVLVAIEAWRERLPLDAGLWVTMGIGRKVVEWFEAAILEDPGLLGPAHPQRGRIDHVLGHLVSVGIAEAHELEKQVEGVAATVSQGLA